MIESATHDLSTVEAVLAEADSLAFRVLADRVMAELPADANGAVSITITIEGTSVEVGDVEVFGFSHSETLTPGLIGSVREWIPAYGTAVIGATNDGVGILYLTTRSGFSYDSIHTWRALYTLGQGADPYEIYTREASRDSITSWRLTSAVPATRLDTYYAPPYAYWSVARLAPDLWLWGSHHTLTTVRGPATDGTYQTILRIQAEETQGFVFLPSRNRVALKGTLYGAGVPIFDTRTGDIAYRIAAITSSYALTATPDESELIVVGRDTMTYDSLPYRIAVVDAETGETSSSAEFGIHPLDAEYDPVRNVIYVAGYVNPYIWVFDKETLELRGRMLGPEVGFAETEMVVDEEAGLLHSVHGGSHVGATLVREFRLLPVQ